jgi:hypothetical protein
MRYLRGMNVIENQKGSVISKSLRTTALHCIYYITSNIRLTFYTFFPVEKFRCVLSSRNMHLSNFFPKTNIQKEDAS